MVAAEVTSQIRSHAILQRPMTMALIPWSLELCPAARQSAPAARAWVLEVWRFPLTRYRRYRQGPLDHPFRDRIPRQPRNVMNIQFIHHLLAVLFHRFDADGEFRGNLLVRKPLGNQLQHFRFARSQFARFAWRLSCRESFPALVAQSFRDGWTEIRVAFLHFANGFEQIIGRRLLDQITR